MPVWELIAFELTFIFNDCVTKWAFREGSTKE